MKKNCRIATLFNCTKSLHYYFAVLLEFTFQKNYDLCARTKLPVNEASPPSNAPMEAVAKIKSILKIFFINKKQDAKVRILNV